MDNLVLRQEESGIVTLTLNQPETRNAISELPMIDALVGTLREADQAQATRVIILTGAGNVFSSGGNVKKMQPGAGLADSRPVRTRGNYRYGIQRIPLFSTALRFR